MTPWPVRGARRTMIIVALAFAIGALVDAGLTWRLQTTAAPLTAERQLDVEPNPSPVHNAIDVPVQRPGDDRRADGAAVGTTGAAANEAAVALLRSHGLGVPVQGISRSQLRDTFSDARGSSRAHEAMDIMAPRRTPVLAVQDGAIAKLFTSKAGGLTIYQFDPSRTFCFYYAHLDGYAAGLSEGQSVKRGQLIGYVGSTGNASAEAPHLHFSIFRLTPEHQWWKGEPINPYPVLR